MRLVLGIETSCDETAAALVGSDRRVLAERVLSQTREHAPFGGIVPEIAARSHLAHLEDMVRGTLADAACDWSRIDAIAATTGPGLIGGVIVGATFAKAVALARGLPFVAINHLEGHALSARLSDDVPFPYLLLLVSGGHCQLLAVEGVGKYRRLGTTLDDAVGEAFDKVAKLLGLGYPGGPAIEKLARDGNPKRFDLPRRLPAGRAATLVRGSEDRRAPDRRSQRRARRTRARRPCRIVPGRGRRLARRPHRQRRARVRVDASGGRASGRRGRRGRQPGAAYAPCQVAAAHGLALVAPPIRLCTDNAAMIAWAGVERLALGLVSPLDIACRPRWPLEELASTAPPSPP